MLTLELRTCDGSTLTSAKLGMRTCSVRGGIGGGGRLTEYQARPIRTGRTKRKRPRKRVSHHSSTPKKRAMKWLYLRVGGG